MSDNPDLRDMLLALIFYEWEVERVSFYEDEGVAISLKEGWKWTEPNGTNHYRIGNWNELPTWPDSAKQAIAKAEGRK